MPLQNPAHDNEQSSGTSPQKPTKKPSASTTAPAKGKDGGYTAESWAQELLKRGGWPVTPANVKAIVAWEAAEGGHWNNTAHFNPLNTTQDAAGASSMNSVGVKAYTSWDQGFDATLKTLHNGNYGHILTALSTGHDAGQVANAVVQSPWGTHTINVNGDYATYGHGPGQTGTYTSGGSGSDGVGNGNLSKGDIKRGLADLDFSEGLIKSNKSLREAFHHILKKGIDVTTGVGAQQAKEILQNTAWFKNHTAAQRTFDEQKFSDPSQSDKALHDARAQIKAEAIHQGVPLTDGQLDKMAHQAVRNGLNGDEVNQLLAKHFHYQGDGTAVGTAGSSIEEIQQLAAKYYVPITDQQLQHYTRQVLSGNLDPSSLSEIFQKQALSMAPYLKDQLAQGQTIADVLDPYKQMMANTLELNPAAIKQNDPSILRALQYKGTDGTTGLMSLGDFQQNLYNDPRWLHTQNAKQSLVSTTGSILQKMGLIT